MANTFIELNDTPSDWTNSQGQFVKVVNSSPSNRLVFTTVSLNDLDNVYVPNPSDAALLSFNQANNRWQSVSCAQLLVAGDGLTIDDRVLSLDIDENGGLEVAANGIAIANISNVSGTYGNASFIPSVTVNDFGQIINVTEVPIDISELEVFNSENILGTPGEITVEQDNGTARIGFVGTGITAGVYGTSTGTLQISVDTYGRVQEIVELPFLGSGNIDLGNANVNINSLTTRAFSQIQIEGVTPAPVPVVASLPHDTVIFAAGTGIEIDTTASNNNITVSVSPEEFISDISIFDLGDVNSTGLANGFVLAWDSVQFVPTQLSLSTIDNIDDVDSTGIQPGQTLIWNSSQFVPGSLVQSLNDLSDVSIFSAPITGQTLVWNGSYFVPNTPVTSSADLSDINLDVDPLNGQTLVWNSSSNQFIAGIPLISVDDLVDAETVGIQAGDVLRYSNTGIFRPHSFELNDLADVNIPEIPQRIDGSAVTWDNDTGRFVLSTEVTATLPVMANITPGTYGNGTIGNIAQITVNDVGLVTEISESPYVFDLGGTSFVERFKVNYAANGDIETVSDLTGGISAVNITGTTTITIVLDNTKYHFPPSSIVFYGYDYLNNKYWIVPLDTTVGTREIPGGGVSGAPTLFSGTSTVEIKLQVRESDTGASRGGFGTKTHAWVQMVI